MTRLASYQITSFQRPRYLRRTLQVLQHQVVPDGWELELVVCCPPADRCADVPGPARIVWTESVTGCTCVGCQNQAALDAVSGEVLLRSGDDDLHHPERLSQVIAAIDAGATMCGYSSAYRVHGTRGDLVRWIGPPDHLGAGMAYRTEIVRAAGGWSCVPRGADGMLRERLAMIGETTVVDLGHTDSAYLWIGGGNRSQNLPWPKARMSNRKGPFTVWGEGCWWFRDWPAPIAEALKGLWRPSISVIGSAWTRRGAAQLAGVASWRAMADTVRGQADVQLLVAAHGCADWGWPDGVQVIDCPEPGIGRQLTYALTHAIGDIIVGAPCDDIQSPMRLYEVIRAHEQGADVSYLPCFIVRDQDTGRLARWDGDGRYAGGKSYRAELLRSIGGWAQPPNGAVDHGTVKRLLDAGAVFRALPEYVGRSTVMAHSTGASRAPAKERPWPVRDVRVSIGNHFRVTGL